MTKMNPMKHIARVLLWLPAWSFTTIVTAAILWLTLAPDPLPDNDLPLFPGFDKVAHACMFGGLYFAAAFDLVSRGCRRKGITQKFAPLPVKAAYITALSVTAFGGAVELIQGAMAMGRGCDMADFCADAAGVAIAMLLTPPVLRAMSAGGKRGQ